MNEIADSLAFDGPPLLNADKDLVVFGSLGRKEFTQRSDVDWTLLVDGGVDASGNMSSAILIPKLLEQQGFKLPGPNGAFGQITFSHGLVHLIGGQDDSNHNLTQRCLLLLESDVIQAAGRTNEGSAYQRVLKATVSQYIANDSGYRTDNHHPHYVPRFLLNDLIRYWRTICVDFASKQIEQDGKKWGIRNIKLRVSRRLIHLKGLLMCFECHRQKLGKLDAIEYLISAVQESPLAYVFSVLSNRELNISNGDMIRMFSAYDLFLEKMNDDDYRKALENLKVDEAYGNETFENARQISKEFHAALKDVLFRNDNQLNKFLIDYGIF
jgi:hypothetical protein